MSDKQITLDKVLDLSAALSPDDQLRLIGMVSERLRQLGSTRVDMRECVVRMTYRDGAALLRSVPYGGPIEGGNGCGNPFYT